MSKHKLLHKSGTRQGMASIYLVVFVSIILGIVSVSFTRVMLSEGSQSTNDDLSQSAYDSAMAGVEHAKELVNQYYNCQNTTGGSCSYSNIFNIKCGQPGYIHNTVSASADQEYTCVVISDEVPDYRGTLTADNRTKVIPISLNANTAGYSTGLEAQVSSVRRIRFSWFSTLNQGSNSTFKPAAGIQLSDYSNKTVPPTVQLTLVRAKATTNVQDFYKPSGENGALNSVMLLLPNLINPGAVGIGANSIDASTINSYDQASVKHEPVSIACSRAQEFACFADLMVSGLNFADDDNIILIATLPYGDTYTDFAVTLYSTASDDTGAIKFKNSQISIDSTGRTSTLFRRVETRLDRTDLFFTYPSFALEVNDPGASTDKNFWITANCWHRSTIEPSNPDKNGPCPQNGDL